MENFQKVWFQEDQRDDFENALVERFNLASNTKNYSEKWTEDIEMTFPIGNFARKLLSHKVSQQQSEKKMTSNDLMKQGQVGNLFKLIENKNDMRSLRFK